MDKHGYTPTSLTALNKENFEDRSYSIEAIEENMELKLISLMKDIPFASTVLESIFSLNPFKTTQEIIQKISSYSKLNDMEKNEGEELYTVLNEIFSSEQEFYCLKNQDFK